MSIARHHNEWLSLVPNSGPFLSLPVLVKAFPQGLPTLDLELKKETRLRFEGWEDGKKDRAVRRSWCDFVLRSVLQFPAEVAAEGQTIPPGMEARMSEFGEVLRPDVAIIPPKGANSIKPRLLVQFFHTDQDLEKPLRDKHWKASPATRMTELLHAADVPLGLITNGEHWMLVHAPRGETSGFASWYAPLWFEEPLTFQAFTTLLSAQRFFGVAETDTIEALLSRSATDQQEVTEQLGRQVRKAVAVLIQSLDKIDQDYKRQLLEGVGDKPLYDAALTVMMRLVFLFSAEERGLLLLGDQLYDQHYAVSTLRDQLQEIADKHVEEILDARFDAWSRLLATFRAVYGGVQHEAMRLPPYGGTLFDPDRFPFLEGRKPGTSWRNTPAEPIKVSNRTVLHLLNALQILQAKVPGSGAVEARRLSFRSLDIEQIGHVYEGLLDHTAKRAAEPVLGLKGSKDKEPEISLSKLEELAGGKVLGGVTAAAETAEPFLLAAETPDNIISLPKGKSSGSYAPPEKLVAFIKAETGRAVGAIKRELTDQSGVDEGRLLLACGHDRALLDRVWPFATLLRDDTFGFPVVIPSGSVYVTQGSDRRSTGTHYTPRSLTEPIVQHTLEPLVYIGPAEGTPREQWKLKSAREILELKVCDMAMGSGAFLVQTCRYLAERLVEAWENAECAHPGKILATPEGDFSEGDPKERLIPADPAERLAVARRYVADRCLYGVDINSMAVEMAKLSLWLITLQRDRPFTFLDHALKCGDSLLGVSALPQIENFSLRPGERQVTFATANLFRYVEQAGQKRRELEDLPSNDHTQIESKNRLHAEAEAATAKVKALADCLIALELRGLDGDAYADARVTEAEQVQRLLKQDADAALKSPNTNQPSALAAHAQERLRGRRPFHWPVEFPEVFARGGFDGLVGNPPFMGGTLATEWLGSDYTALLQRLMPPWHGKADYVVGFFKRIPQLIHGQGKVSLVATSSLLRGETLDSGLRDLRQQQWQVYSARSPYKWPGTATLEVVNASFSRGWNGKFVLDGKIVDGITEEFTAGEPDGLAPKELPTRHLEGALGIKLCPANREVQFRQFDRALSEAPELQAFFVPALGGDEIYDLTDFALAPRSIQPEKLSAFLSNGGHLTQRGGITILSPAEYAHSAPASGLMSVLARARFVFACGETSTTLRFCRVPNTNCILKHKLIIFPGSSWSLFAILQSDVHVVWAWRWGLRRESRIVYSPKRCALTFPLPPAMNTQFEVGPANLTTLGEQYHEFRHEIMLARQEGLTKTYNRFHDQGEASADIARLRALHVELDQAVAAAYGWHDLDLGHGFHPTKQGERYTLSEPARRTVLDRLLALNHQRYEEEVKAGLHDKGAKKPKKTKVASPSASQRPATGGVQFGLGLALPASAERTLSTDFRLPASDGAHYAVSLVFALLSEAGGSLPFPRLRDAFVLATSPKLMQRFAPGDEGPRVKAWAQRWNEDAKPAMFLDSLKAIGARHLTVSPGAEGRIFQLLDGPRPPANEDVGYDAWIALRVASTLAPSTVLLPECAAWTKQAEELVLA